jgi:hypothetical protein
VAGYLRESDDVFVYHAGTGQLQDLGRLGFYSQAQCMNNSGQICGFGVHNGLQLRGFLITPVSHPYFLAQPAKSIPGK